MSAKIDLKQRCINCTNCSVPEQPKSQTGFCFHAGRDVELWPDRKCHQYSMSRLRYIHARQMQNPKLIEV